MGGGALNEELITIIFALIVPFVGIFIGFKTKNMGRDEKYNRGHPTCLDNSTSKNTAVLVPKCSYCHKAANEKFPTVGNKDLKELYFCSEECKKQIIEYVDVVNRHGMLFLGLTLGSVFLMVIGSGIVNALNFDGRYALLIVFIALVVVGLTIIKFPFCTPQTVQLVGIKKAKIVGRCLGFIVIIGALVASIRVM